MPRNLRTPQHKAQDAVDLADRKVKRLQDRLAKAVAAAAEIKVDVDAAIVELDYAKANPVLHPVPKPEVEATLDGKGTLVVEVKDA